MGMEPQRGVSDLKSQLVNAHSLLIEILTSETFLKEKKGRRFDFIYLL